MITITFKQAYSKISKAQKLLIEVVKNIKYDKNLGKEIINSIDKLDLILYDLSILKWKEEIKQEKAKIN